MATREYAGSTIETTDDGYLVNSNEWSVDIAKEIAKEEGIEELNDRHMLVVDFMREVFSKTGDGPSIRKLTKESGVPTKELYSLFPKGPAKKAARIAGIPKPKGCI
jgi:tRNA 2-thiouridine synthesizing protein E